MKKEQFDELDQMKIVLAKYLKENLCEVYFQKADGTVRKMICTKHSDLYPADLKKQMLEEAKKNVDKPKRKTNPNTFIVYDMEKLAWRSFNLQSVLEFNIIHR